MAFAHAAPQAPQFAALVLVFASQPFEGEPSQFSMPPLHAVQAPFEHVSVVAAHATAVPHCPALEHVCVALPVHSVAPGVHTPVHAPEAHAEDTQGDAVPHCPLELHVCTPLPEHRVMPGEQTPEQVPLTQAWFVQEEAPCQEPFVSHVCGTSPLHCFDPGLHVPEQAPPLHTLMHVVPFTHPPFASQV